jgi:AraC-like DNA-binding protein
MSSIHREVTQLTENDCFTLFSRVKSGFDFPLHYHDEFELNFIANAKGARRIIGDHSEVIDDLELVLVGSNLPHGWFKHQCESDQIQEITIQFHKDLFDVKCLSRNQLSFIRALLERASKGILFSRETIQLIRPRLEALVQKSGFDSVLELLSILHDLSISRMMRTLSNTSLANDQLTYSSRRLERAFAYMQTNYAKDITLNDVAQTVNMLDVSFSRFISKRTGKTFIESLNDIRLGHATQLLIDTPLTVTEISFNCGFNNLSYFNRLFRRKHNCTPREFRTNNSGVRVFI